MFSAAVAYMLPVVIPNVLCVLVARVLCLPVMHVLCAVVAHLPDDSGSPLGPMALCSRMLFKVNLVSDFYEP